MQFDRIVLELEEIEKLKRLVKRQSMIYQFDLKSEVAEAFGIPKQKLYDMPYKEWAAIRSEYLKKKEA